jgi:hypothetical protein
MRCSWLTRCYLTTSYGCNNALTLGMHNPSSCIPTGLVVPYDVTSGLRVDSLARHHGENSLDTITGNATGVFPFSLTIYGRRNMLRATTFSPKRNRKKHSADRQLERTYIKNVSTLYQSRLTSQKSNLPFDSWCHNNCCARSSAMCLPSGLTNLLLTNLTSGRYSPHSPTSAAASSRSRSRAALRALAERSSPSLSYHSMNLFTLMSRKISLMAAAGALSLARKVAT